MFGDVFSTVHLLEVLLAGADVALVAIHRHVYQFAQVSHSVGGQTESGVPDRRDVSVPQDARVCSNHKPNTGQRGGETGRDLLSAQAFRLGARAQD